MPKYTSTFSLLLFFLTFLFNLVTLRNDFTYFLMSFGNKVKTQAIRIEPEITDSIHACINLLHLLPDSNACSIAWRICVFGTLAHTMVAYPHIIFLLIHTMLTYLGQFGVAGPHLFCFLRLTSFKTLMMRKIFLSPRPPPKPIWLCVLTWFHIGMSKFVSLYSTVALSNTIFFYLLRHLTT